MWFQKIIDAPFAKLSRAQKYLVVVILALIAFIIFKHIYYISRCGIACWSSSSEPFLNPVPVDNSARNDNLSLSAYYGAADTPTMKYGLYNYVVKSSFNSCVSFSVFTQSYYVAPSVLAGVLRKGYRFIDLELIKNADGKIAVTANNTYMDQSNTSGVGSFPLTDAIDTIVAVGLASGPKSAANYSEPLFLHLRIKPREDATSNERLDFYNQIYTVLTSVTPISTNTDSGGGGNNISNFLFHGGGGGGGGNDKNALESLVPNALLGTGNNCVLFLDGQFLTPTEFNKSKLATISFFGTGVQSADADANIVSMNDLVSGNIDSATAPLINTDHTTVAQRMVVIALPTLSSASSAAEKGDPYFGNSVPDIALAVKTYGVNFPAVGAYALSDTNLRRYESLFSATSGFQLMSTVIKMHLAGITPL